MGGERAIQLEHEHTVVHWHAKGEALRNGLAPEANGESVLSHAAAESFDQCLEAQDAERRRLAQELHDSTGYLFLELSMEIGKLRRSPGFANAAELIDAIDEAASHIDQEIRSISFMRYPQELGDRRLDNALDLLCRGFARRTGLDVQFRGEYDRRVAMDTAVALLRIAQEALTNAHRHAHANKVRVSLAQQRDRLMLRICDDGVGIPAEFDVREHSGVGVRAMAHRSERLGGRFALYRLKRGTAVVATVPYVSLAC